MATSARLDGWPSRIRSRCTPSPMTGEQNPIYWQPETLRVFHEVRRMRDDGLECYFSVDTGATVYINCRPDDVKAVEKQIAALGVETATGKVGGPARAARKHLF